MLPGSGVEPVDVVVPCAVRVKASEGIDPVSFWACDGQPGDMQPAPEFCDPRVTSDRRR